jgi:uncharacterized protein YjbI with pentapeptide repeats
VRLRGFRDISIPSFSSFGTNLKNIQHKTRIELSCRVAFSPALHATFCKNESRRLKNMVDKEKGGGKSGAGDKQPLRPNMLLSNMKATSSTLDQVQFDHCIFNNSDFADSLFKDINIRSVSFQQAMFDGSGFQRCSLRGVQFQDCNIEGLVINGIRIGDLLRRIAFDGGSE